MKHQTKTLIQDATATTLSVLFLEYAFLFSLVGGGIKWDRIIFNSITGIFSYWLALFLLRDKHEFIGIPVIIFSIILGSSFWILFRIAYLIYFDWRYLSDIRPETFIERNTTGNISYFFYFLSMDSLVSLFFVGLFRVFVASPRLWKKLVDYILGKPRQRI